MKTRYSNEFDLRDIDSVLGTNLSSVSSSINNAQNAVNSIQPAINWIVEHYILIILGLFIMMITASLIANKING
jgi:hypothetical protein